MQRMIFLLLLFSPWAFSQNTEIVHENQVWTGYFNQIRLTNKWGLWTDVHFRTTHDFVKEPSKAILRGGLMYYVNNDLKLTSAYAFINHFPEEGHAEISQPEHRIWQQVQLHSHVDKIRIMSWFRIEERFRHKVKSDTELGEGYRYDTRFRSNVLLNFPLSKKGIAPKTFSAILNNEIFINLKNKRNATYFPFDQNRFFVGLSYNLTKHSNLQFGYMNVYQQLVANKKFRQVDAIRIFYFQNLDLRKK